MQKQEFQRTVRTEPKLTQIHHPTLKKKSLSPKGELFLSREGPQAVVFEEQAQGVPDGLVSAVVHAPFDELV